MVNLEIWDVVDKAIVPSNISDLPPSSNPSHSPNLSKNLLPADASTIDVYKGAHAVIFLVDPTRKWTLDYAEKHLPKVPHHIDVALLFSKKDLSEHWTLSKSDIDAFVAKQRLRQSENENGNANGAPTSNIRALEISLLDCFGMKELHSFFNVPFLRMKAKYLSLELARAQREHEQSQAELDVLCAHQNYEQFLWRLKSLRAGQSAKGGGAKSKVSKRVAAAKASVGMSPKPKDDTAKSDDINGADNGATLAVSPSPNSPVLPAKQTVTSSKDLPLIRQQMERQQRQLDELKAQTQSANKQSQMAMAVPTANASKSMRKGSGDVLNIDTFKPKGGLNDDFFADLGNGADDDDKELSDADVSEDEDDEEEAEAVAVSVQRPKRIGRIGSGGIGFEVDGDESDDEEEVDNGGGGDSEKDAVEVGVSARSKLQSLAMFEPEESGSEDSDDEPLVFAAMSKSKSPIVLRPVNVVRDTLTTKPAKVQKVVKVQKDEEKEKALDAFMNDLSTAESAASSTRAKSASPKVEVPAQEDDDGSDDVMEKERQRKKEEKRLKRKERKERKKRKRKEKKRRKKPKDDDIVEFADSDSNELVEIE